MANESNKELTSVWTPANIVTCVRIVFIPVFMIVSALSRRETGRRARQLDARGRLRAARARRAPRHPLRPRRPLPLARLDLDLRGARPRQEHVRQGLQPGQRGDGGLLRPAQEGVLARQGLVGLDPCPLHRGARGLDRPIQYGEAQRCARRPHAGRVPRRAGKGRVTVQEIVRSPGPCFGKCAPF